MSQARIRGPQLWQLFLSYQRYSFFLFTCGLLGLTFSFWLARSDDASPWLRWPLVVAVSGISIRLVFFAAKVASNWPRKRRATELAIRRIESGRFRPQRLRRYFEDPCYRVVGCEILRRSALSHEQQRSIIAELTKLAREPEFRVYVNPHQGDAVTVQGAMALTAAHATSKARNEDEQ